MQKKDFTFIVWQEDRHFVAQCLDIDVSSFGETHDSALANLREAVELYLEDGAKIPFPSIQKPGIVVQSFQYA